MAVTDLVIGAQESPRHLLGIDEIVAAAAAVMAHGQLAAHPLDQAVQVRAAGQLGQEDGVLVAHGFPVHAMHARIIEIVAVDAPHLVENLRPLGARIGLHLDGVDLDLAFAGRQQFARGGPHGPVVLVAVQQLLAVGRDVEIVRFRHHGFRLALLQVEALHGLLAVAFAQQEDLPRGARLQPGELRGRQRQVDDARGDAVEIDVDGRHGSHRDFRVVAARLRVDLRLALRFRFRLGRVFPALRAGGLFLVAFLDQGRWQVAPQHGHPHGARHQVVFVLLREPVVAGARIRRGEEVQVLAALVEHGQGHVGQAIGDGHRLVLLDGIDVGAARVGGRIERVGQPARIGRPRGAHALVDAIHRLRGDFLHLARADIDHVHAPAIVGVGDLFAVGRPDGIVIEAAAIELELAHRALAILGAHMQLVLARFVREVRDGAAIGRPVGRALVGARRLRQVAHVALVGGDGDDLAAVLEGDPGARRRDRRVADVFRVLDPARARLPQVAGHADGQLVRLAAGDVERVQVAGLFVDDGAIRRRRVEHGEIRVPRQLAHGFRLHVVGEQVEFAVAVGTEVHGVAQPHGVDVVRARGRLGDFLDRLVARREEPQPGIGAAPVALPLLEGGHQRVVGDALAIGRIGGARRVGNLQLGFHAARHGHRKQLLEAVVEGGAGRGEHHGLAIGRKRLRQVGARVEGQAARHAARRRDHVHVDIAIDIRAIRDQAAIGRKHGIGLLAQVRRQAPRAAAVQVRQPQIARIDEGDVPAGDGRFAQHAGVLGIGQGQGGMAQQQCAGGRDGGQDACLFQSMSHL